MKVGTLVDECESLFAYEYCFEFACCVLETYLHTHTHTHTTHTHTHTHAYGAPTPTGPCKYSRLYARVRVCACTCACVCHTYLEHEREPVCAIVNCQHRCLSVCQHSTGRVLRVIPTHTHTHTHTHTRVRRYQKPVCTSQCTDQPSGYCQQPCRCSVAVAWCFHARSCKVDPYDIRGLTLSAWLSLSRAHTTVFCGSCLVAV